MSHRLQVLIPEELDAALSQAAARDRVSKGEFVRSALEAALAQRLVEADPVTALAAINARRRTSTRCSPRSTSATHESFRGLERPDVRRRRTTPYKDPSLRFLARAQRGEIQAVTSTEVLQEILHRYHRLGHPDVASRVYDLVVQLCAEVLPVTIADTDECVHLLRDVDGSVRDALHVAVMRNNEVSSVATYDAGFAAFAVTRWPLN